MLDTVVDETFVTFAGCVFHQDLGIPMGGNASSTIADLMLSMMEFAFAKNPVNPRLNVCRYIDDVFAIDCPNFLQLASQIYGSDLDLATTHSGNHCDFLDLSVTIDGVGSMSISVYNKIDAFPFRVKRFGYPDSNVSGRVHMTTIYGQLLRYARISSKLCDFEAKSKDLFDIYKEHGFSRSFLMNQFFMFVSKSSVIFLKYCLPDKTNIANIARRIFV